MKVQGSNRNTLKAERELSLTCMDHMGYVLAVKEAPIFARVKKVGTYKYLQIVENHQRGYLSGQDMIVGTASKAKSTF